MNGFDLEKLLKDENGEWIEGTQRILVSLAGANDTDIGRALETVLARWIAQRNLAQATHPERNDKDLSKDWVYRAGTIAAVEAVRQLAKEAEKTWNKLKGGQRQ